MVQRNVGHPPRGNSENINVLYATFLDFACGGNILTNSPTPVFPNEIVSCIFEKPFKPNASSRWSLLFQTDHTEAYMQYVSFRYILSMHFPAGIPLSGLTSNDSSDASDGNPPVTPPPPPLAVLHSNAVTCRGSDFHLTSLVVCFEYVCLPTPPRVTFGCNSIKFIAESM